MAPRMKMAVSKRKERPEQAERRSKARAERGRPPQVEQSPSPPREAPLPPSPAPRSSLLSSRIVSLGRRIDFNFLEREGFEIGNRLKEMGWEYICSLSLPTYPELVKEFYENGNFSKGSVETMVKGRYIQFSDSLLGEIIRAPAEGDTCNQLSERAEGINLILEKEDASEFEEVNANQLSAEMRLLHHIINRLLFPKTGRFDYVSERDILVMHHVLQGFPLNLPSLMIDHMIDLGRRKGGSLPYGMVLTLIFIQSGVSLEGETKKELLHTDIYNDRSLRRMGFVKVGDRWMHRGQEERSEAPRESAPSTSRPTEIPPPPQETRPEPPQSARLDQNQLNEMMDYLLSRLSASNQSTFDSIYAMIREQGQAQQDRIRSLEEEMRSLRIEVAELRSLKIEVEQNTRSIESAGQEILRTLQQMSVDFQQAGGSVATSLTVLTAMVTNLLSEIRSSRRPPPGPPPSSSHPPPPPPSSGPSSSSSYPRITEID